MKNLIQELIDIQRPAGEIDEMLDFLSNVMREMKELENEIKNQ